jgi:hypothetical protein
MVVHSISPFLNPSLIVRYNEKAKDEKNINFSYSLLYFNGFKTRGERQFVRAMFFVSVFSYEVEANELALSDTYDIIYQESIEDFWTNDKYVTASNPYIYSNANSKYEFGDILNESFISIDASIYPSDLLYFSFIMCDEYSLISDQEVSLRTPPSLPPLPMENGNYLRSNSYGLIYNKNTKTVNESKLMLSHSNPIFGAFGFQSVLDTLSFYNPRLK